MVRAMLAGAIVVAVVAVLAAGGAALVGRGESTRDPGERFSAMSQSAAATDQGIRVEVLGATFSGTETLLRMRVTVVDADTVKAAVGTDDIWRIMPAPDGFGGDIGPGDAVGDNSGDLLVRLPPLVPPADYSGEVRLSLRKVLVYAGGRPSGLSGNWPLLLAGPPPDEVARALRVEELNEVALAIHGEDVTVRGLRSTTETRATIVLPEGMRMITQPMLVDGGERVGPYLSREQDGELVASYPATPFGSEVAFELGAAVVVDDGDVPPLVIDLGAALKRSPKGSEEFPIAPEDVVAGPAELVLGGEQGRYGTRPWVGVVIAGNWHPDDQTPALFDADGHELERAHVQVGYRKSVDGSVLEGTTSIAAFVDKISEVGVITVVLGGPSEIVGQGERVTLRPE